MKNKFFITVEVETDMSESEINEAIFQNQDISNISAIGLTVITSQNNSNAKGRRQKLKLRNAVTILLSVEHSV